jgi:NAD(P)-dependent dehydrogenase (short-subunit alcohol dehydrogenase family)
MTLSLEGRVALVTGAGGGLGRSHALELARRGAQVVVNDFGGTVAGAGSSPGPAKLVVDEIIEAGGVAIANSHSVATPEGAGAMVETAVREFGRIDIVVNNAGILCDEAMHKLTLESWEAVLAVHLTGTMLVTHAAFPHMREQGYGRIVNTTSAAGLFGNFGQCSYGAAKMGIVGLTRVLAIEGGPKGVRVNAVSPAALTRMTEAVMGPLGDVVVAKPELVTPVVVYLAHEGCSLNGEVISAAFGRVSRIFVGTTPGYFNLDLTPEAVEAHLTEIMDEKGLVFPQSINDEIALIMGHYEEQKAVV